MNTESSPGTLYVVATPIGNLEDISARAIRILGDVDVVLAEDTRTGRYLLRHFGIATRLSALHAHNEHRRNHEYLEMLEAGKTIALISEAGTPLISDPGFTLVGAAQSRRIRVVPVPGACAAIAALSVSGLPCHRFVFEGFLPTATASRRRTLEALLNEARTMVFFEAPHRIAETMADLVTVFGPARRACFARELTKLHETILNATLEEIATAVADDPNQRRGEIVLCVQGTERSEPEVDKALRIAAILRRYLPPGQAAAAASEITGVRRKDLYPAPLAEEPSERSSS